jgi:hypothetical protein
MRRRFRPRLWMLLAAVAVAAMGADGAAMLLRRREHYRQLAAYHSSQASPLWQGDPGYFFPENLGPLFWHEQMRQKYEKAARHPWLRVEPNPPRPEAKSADLPPPLSEDLPGLGPPSEILPDPLPEEISPLATLDDFR